MKYEETIDAICNASRLKMLINSHKGDIEQLDPKTAIGLAKGELDELLEAMEADNYEKAITECGDVMNFIISVGYNAIEGYRRRK